MVVNDIEYVTIEDMMSRLIRARSAWRSSLVVILRQVEEEDRTAEAADSYT